MITPSLTLGEIVDLVGGRLSGDPSLTIRGVSSLADASPDQIALLAAPRYRALVPESRAGALLVSSGLNDALDDARPRVVVADAHAALAVLLARFEPPPPPRPGVHPSALLGKGVALGADPEIGPYAVVGEGSTLGDRVRIGAHAVIGSGCRVGADTVLHPHVTLYDGVAVGARVTLHAGVRIGSDGFGYAFTAGGHTKVPQVGGCVVEDDVEIGANSCVDRGSLGDTVIGRGCKLDNQVHVAHNVRLGPHCVITAQVGIAGSTTLGEGVQMGGQSGIAGHLAIGDRVGIGAGSGVYHDVPAGGTVLGSPAADIRIMKRAWALIPRLPELFRRLRVLEGKAPALPGAGPDDRDGRPADG